MINYLNNAGVGIISEKTYEAVVAYMQLERKIGAYPAASESRSLTEGFYLNAAKLINAGNPYEIAFMDSASRGWNMVVYGTPLNKGDRIITLSSEFATNLLTLFDHAEKNEAEVCVIKCNSKGDFPKEDIEKKLKDGAKLIAMSHAAAHGSIVNPVEEIGALAKRYGAIYIVDGCQAVGQFPVDVRKIQCDAYTAAGRKWLRGPRGTGFLYVKQSAPFRTAQLDLSSAGLIMDSNSNVKGVDIRKDARQFELWERSYANMIGLSSALNECLENNISEISKQIQEFSNQLRLAASSNPRFNLNGHIHSVSGIVGFYLTDPSLEESLDIEFRKRNISISLLSDEDYPLYFPKRGAAKIFRLSPHYYTDKYTVETACEILLNF